MYFHPSQLYQFPFDTSHNHKLQQKMTQFLQSHDITFPLSASDIMKNYDHTASRQTLPLIRIMVNGKGKMIEQLGNTPSRVQVFRKNLTAQIQQYNFLKSDTSDFPFLYVAWSEATQVAISLSGLLMKINYMKQKGVPNMWPNAPGLRGVEIIQHPQLDGWQKLTQLKNISIQRYENQFTQTAKYLTRCIFFKKESWDQRGLYISHGDLVGLGNSRRQIQKINTTIAILYKRLLDVKALIQQNIKRKQEQMKDQSQRLIQTRKKQVMGFLATATTLASFGLSTQPLSISMGTNEHVQYIYVCESILNVLRWAVQQQPDPQNQISYKRLILQCISFCSQSIHFYLKGRFTSEQDVKQMVRKIHVYCDNKVASQQSLVDSIYDTKYIPTIGFTQTHYEVAQLMQGIMIFILKIATIADTYQQSKIYTQYLTYYKLIQYTNSRMMQIMTVETTKQIWQITGVSQKNPFRQLIRMACYFCFLYLKKLNHDFSLFSTKIFHEQKGASSLEVAKRDISSQYKMQYTSIQWFLKNIKTTCDVYVKILKNTKPKTVPVMNFVEQLSKTKQRIGQDINGNPQKQDKIKKITQYEGNELKQRYMHQLQQSTALYRKFLLQIDQNQKYLQQKHRTQSEKILQLDRYALALGEYNPGKDRYVQIIRRFVTKAQSMISKMMLPMRNDSFAIGCLDFTARLNPRMELVQTMGLFQQGISVQQFSKISTPQLYQWIQERKKQSKFFSQTGIDKNILTDKTHIDHTAIITTQDLQRNFFIRRTNKLFQIKKSIPSLIQILKRNNLYNQFISLFLDKQQSQTNKKQLLKIFSTNIFPKLSEKTDIKVIQMELNRLKQSLKENAQDEIDFSKLGQVQKAEDYSQFHVQLFENFNTTFRGKAQAINQTLLLEKQSLQRQVLDLKAKIRLSDMKNMSQINDLGDQIQKKNAMIAAHTIGIQQLKDRIQKQKITQFQLQQMQTLGQQIANSNAGLFTQENKLYMTKFMSLLMQQYPQDKMKGLKQFFKFLGKNESQDAIKKYLEEAQKNILNRNTRQIIATQSQVQQAGHLVKIITSIFQKNGIQQKFNYLTNKQQILSQTINYERKKIEQYKQQRLKFEEMASSALLANFQKNMRYIIEQKKKLFDLISEFFGSFKTNGSIYDQFKAQVERTQNSIMKQALNTTGTDIQTHQFRNSAAKPLEVLTKFQTWGNALQTIGQATQNEIYVLSDEIIDQKQRIIKKIRQEGKDPNQANIISKMLEQIRYNLSSTQKQISNAKALKEVISCFYKDMVDRKAGQIKLMSAVQIVLNALSQKVVPLLDHKQTQAHFHKFHHQVQLIKKRNLSRTYAFTKCFIPGKHRQLKQILDRLQQFFPTGYSALGEIKTELQKKQKLINKILQE